MTDAALPRKTFFSGIALPVFSWALPFHSLMVAILFGALGFSAGAVRRFAAWKEMAVVGLVVLVVIRAAMGKGPRVSISWVDIAVGSLLFIACAFFVAGNVWLRQNLPVVAERYGLLGTVVLLTTVGVMINALTGVVFNALVLSYLYFWFAGAIVTVAQQERAPSRAQATIPLELATA